MMPIPIKTELTIVETPKRLNVVEKEALAFSERMVDRARQQSQLILARHNSYAIQQAWQVAKTLFKNNAERAFTVHYEHTPQHLCDMKVRMRIEHTPESVIRLQVELQPRGNPPRVHLIPANRSVGGFSSKEDWIEVTDYDTFIQAVWILIKDDRLTWNHAAQSSEAPAVEVMA